MRIGRNDPCHCGSGRKYKKCCLSFPEALEVHSLDQILERAIPPGIIGEILDEVDEWSAPDFRRVSGRLAEEYPTLLMFVASLIEPMPVPVRDQALITVLTVIQMFERHYGSHHEPIREHDMMRLIQRNIRMAKDLEESRMAPKTGDVVQPFVMQFISDFGFDFDEEEQPDKRDALTLVLTLKTVVDILDHAFTAPVLV
jgi:hypothetical protein